MSVKKATIKTLEGKEATLIGQTPIPCFRCGVCCTCYQAPLTAEDVDNIATALGISRAKCLSRYAVKVAIKEGHLLKRTGKGCVFLGWNADGRARCAIYVSRPRACQEWIPSLSRPECREGLAKLKSEGRIMLLKELFPSYEDQRELHRSAQEET
jgi:Fe-S-cluster containining protein